MENNLNIDLFYLPSLFISEKISEVLKNKNITVSNGANCSNVFKQWIIDWLRVEKSINVSVNSASRKKLLTFHNSWYYFIDSFKRDNLITSEHFKTYEECQEAAILAALELI